MKFRFKRLSFSVGVQKTTDLIVKSLSEVDHEKLQQPLQH